MLSLQALLLGMRKVMTASREGSLGLNAKDVEDDGEAVELTKDADYA